MTEPLSPNAQAILLLTAPLIVGRDRSPMDLLTPAQYKGLAQALRQRDRQPADLLGPEADALCTDLAAALAPRVDRDRLRALLDRGFQLTQALERWQARAIWVVSRADAEFPRRFKARLKDDAPAVLYGCGDRGLLATGGLAVVGSRHVDETLIEHTEAVGRLVAKAGRTLVSGAARGVDQAAMRGALQVGGRAVGVLADSLATAAVNRENRDLLLDQRLLLVSPYDPTAGFNVGNAMQRNKLIYALADAALVVSSDFKKGGTWSGAVEQLQKHRTIPVYIRSTSEPNRGLDGLRELGALSWPELKAPEDLAALLDTRNVPTPEPKAAPADVPVTPKLAEPETPATAATEPPQAPAATSTPLNPAEELFATVRTLVARLEAPKTEAEIAETLQVSKPQAKEWLSRLVAEGVLEKSSRPTRYRAATAKPHQSSLFS
jgi:predicted Rossmann fold nucleotide-binding protein DprA/Smf involved in DNA uptake